MNRIIKKKLGNEYSIRIVDGNSNQVAPSLKKQLKSLSKKTISKRSKPYLIIFYFRDGCK